VPEYKNRPSKSGDTPVWRYLGLSAVIATIKTQQLRLTRVDKFQDPFQGSVPKAVMDEQTLLLIGAESQRATNRIMQNHYSGMASSMVPDDEDSWTRITRLRRAKTRSAHASCWSAGEESEALWRLYSADDGCPGVGIALQTTLARLEESVAPHDLYVSPITYVRYHEARPFTDEMDHLLHKRHGFSAERELRLLKFDQAHYGALATKDASASELPQHVYMDWVLRDVIDEIVISPYAGKNYEDLARVAINATDPNLPIAWCCRN
jgi:hypothetical protein